MAAMGMRHAVGALVIGGLVLGSLAAGGLVLGRVGLVDDEYAAKQADRAFVAGLARGDSKAIRGMLDRHFPWIDAGLPVDPGTPASQMFRIEGGMNRYIHEVTVCTTKDCGRARPGPPPAPPKG